MPEKHSVSLQGMIYASMFGAATAVGAFIIIPFPLVPITLQTLFLNLAAGLLGGTLGALSQIVYVILGILGLPVFAGGKAGAGVLFGPTGGYLIGFIPAAYIIGKLIAFKEKPGLCWFAFSMTVGLMVYYLLGVTQLALVAGLSLKKSVAVGILPFLIGDACKIAAASLLTLKLKNKIFYQRDAS
jgi:biotin transport system substrate-specific component